MAFGGGGPLVISTTGGRICVFVFRCNNSSKMVVSNDGGFKNDVFCGCFTLGKMI